MKFNYAYKIDYWDEMDAKVKTEFGVIQEENLNDAMTAITNWYGEDSINYIEFHVIEDGPIKMTEEQYNEYTNCP